MLGTPYIGRLCAAWAGYGPYVLGAWYVALSCLAAALLANVFRQGWLFDVLMVPVLLGSIILGHMAGAPLPWDVAAFAWWTPPALAALIVGVTWPIVMLRHGLLRADAADDLLVWEEIAGYLALLGLALEYPLWCPALPWSRWA